MANLEKIIKLTPTQYNTLSNGGTVNGQTGLKNNQLYLIPDSGLYGYCNTSSSSQKKAVTIESFMLTAGTRVLIWFNYQNTATYPYLNINNTGNFPIKYLNSHEYGSVIEKYRWIEFLFDGSSYQIVGFQSEKNISGHNSLTIRVYVEKNFGNRWERVPELDPGINLYTRSTEGKQVFMERLFGNYEGDSTRYVVEFDTFGVGTLELSTDYGIYLLERIKVFQTDEITTYKYFLKFNDGELCGAFDVGYVSSFASSLARVSFTLTNDEWVD